MALELTVAGEAESTDDSNNRRRVRLQALGHGANAEQHVLARMLEDRPDDFLPLDTELINALCEMGCGWLGVYLLAIHVARGLPNLGRVSTWSPGDRDPQRAEQSQALLFRRGSFGFQSGGNHRLKEGHHRTKFRAELFDGQRLLAMGSGEEVGAALFVFFDPGHSPSRAIAAHRTPRPETSCDDALPSTGDCPRTGNQSGRDEKVAPDSVRPAADRDRPGSRLTRDPNWAILSRHE